MFDYCSRRGLQKFAAGNGCWQGGCLCVDVGLGTRRLCMRQPAWKGPDGAFDCPTYWGPLRSPSATVRGRDLVHLQESVCSFWEFASARCRRRSIGRADADSCTFPADASPFPEGPSAASGNSPGHVARFAPPPCAIAPRRRPQNSERVFAVAFRCRPLRASAKSQKATAARHGLPYAKPARHLHRQTRGQHEPAPASWEIMISDLQYLA